ncbi:MAG: insulinase family protein [Spirochaetes bacterium]|nr:insulinase family protein [Spirochaetota bacterium]
MKRFVTLAASLALALALAAPVFAETTPIPGLQRFMLDNGLELFVLENHSSPLVYVEIAFRCGAYAQTPDTAGLFHFYEHMMFKGNKKFRTQAEVIKAYLDLGVSSWNGSTSAEYVNYYFTVPADKAGQGLEFWSQAVREPLLDSGELESEKGVVTSEIQGSLSDPKEILSSSVDRRLFPDFPWRRDPGGSVDVLQSCTVEKLKAIKDAYYIPNNAALFVGGDIKPGQALALVKKYYGSWKRGPDPWKGGQQAQRFPATDKSLFLVYPDPNVSPNYGIVYTYQRGPDVSRSPAPTYAADVFGYLMEDPSGAYKSTVFGMKDLAIPNPNYMGGFYWTQRDGGQIQNYAYLMTKAVLPFAERGRLFAEAVTSTLPARIIAAPDYYSGEDYETVKTIIEDEQILGLETVDGFLGNLRFWWASASTDYYFGYVPNMKKAGHAEIAKYLEDYLVGNPPIVVVRVNPQVYEQQKASFDKLGYELIDAETAFWWKK